MKIKILVVIAVIIFSSVNIYSQVAVIANKSVPDNSVTSAQLTEIFSLNKKNWADGSKIVVFDLKVHEGTSEKFYESLGKLHADFKKLWMKLQLTGEGTAPAALASEDEVLAKVASTPGAVGFVNSSKANNTVKVLLIIK